MAETEELQLRVSLDDQASAQLAALRGQLDQMRGGSAAAPIVAAIAPVVQQLTAMVDQLAQLPAQITSAMSSAAQGLGQVQTQLTQISTQIQQATSAVAAVPGHVAQGAQGLTAAIRKASFEGGFFGNLASKGVEELVGQLTSLGNNLIMRATDFHGLADSMKDLQTHAEGVGRTMTGYQGLERQLQLGGMSPEQARDAISRAADRSGEFKQYGAENAPVTRRLLANINPEDTGTIKYISEAMKKMEGATLEEQLNLWIEMKENMRETMTKAKRGEHFEAAWKEIEDAGAPKGLEQLEEKFRARQETTSPAREQMLTARTEETKEFNKESLKASFYWKDIGQSLAGSLLHGLKLNNAVGELNTWLVHARGELETFERVYRETGDLEKALAALDPAFAPFVREVHDLLGDILKIGPDIKAWKDWFAESFSGLTEAWNSLPEGLRDVLSGKATMTTHHEAPPQISGREATQMEKIDPHSNYTIYERMKQQGYTDEQIRAYFEKYKNSPPEHAWTPLQHELGLGHQPGAPEPAGRPPPPPPSTPPPPTDGIELTPEQRERLRRRYRRGPGGEQPSAPPADRTLPEIEVKPQQPDEQFDPLSGLPLSPSKQPPTESKPPPPPPEYKTPPWYEKKMRGRELPPQQQPSIQLPAAPGFASFQQAQFREPSPWDTTPTPPPPGPNEARAANVEPNRFRNLPRSTHIEDRRPPGGGEYHSVDDLDAAEKRQQFIKEYNEKLKGPEGQAWLKGGENAIGQIQLGKPSTGEPLDKLTEGLDKYLYDLAQKHGWTSEQKSKAGAPRFGGEDGSSFDERFGTWPSTGADKLDQTSNKLDQAANTNVNISGAGKIQVDVRAPPGTSVDASGEGFFKSTEITRLTQMLPADMGPLPMTGVGAGQGVAGNGTVSA